MGRLLSVDPCPVCNYHVEGPLHFGGSTRSRLFIHHRYLLAICRTCRHLVSVLVATPDYDLPTVLQSAADDLATLEARAAEGDVDARKLLPLHHAALEPADDDESGEIEVERCTFCGSADLLLLPNVGGDEGERFDDADAWVDCPRCGEGKLLIHTEGHWDEIDTAP